MIENNITGLVIKGELYNIVPNGVKCTECAIKDVCLKGKLGTTVQFDCASVHLVKHITNNDADANDYANSREADQALMLEQSGIYE